MKKPNAAFKTQGLRLKAPLRLVLAGQFTAGCALATILSSCAPRMDAAKNNINQELNEGGQVAVRVNQLHAETIAALAHDFPVCVAYTLAGHIAPFNQTFTSTLQTIDKTLINSGLALSNITVYYGQRPGYSDITAEVASLKRLLPQGMRKATIYTAPSELKYFRQAAHCRRKDMIFIYGNEVQFITKLPVEMLTGDRLPIAEVMFIVIDDVHGT